MSFCFASASRSVGRGGNRKADALQFPLRPAQPFAAAFAGWQSCLPAEPGAPSPSPTSLLSIYTIPASILQVIFVKC